MIFFSKRGLVKDLGFTGFTRWLFVSFFSQREGFFVDGSNREGV